jgi:hypothetical protein
LSRKSKIHFQRSSPQMETHQPLTVERGAMTVLASIYFSSTDKVKLFKNDLVPTPDTVLADLTEADFTGYAPVTIAGAWNASTDPQERGLVWYSALVPFSASGAAVPNIIYGWYVVNTDGTVLKVVKRLDTPITFDSGGDELVLKLLVFGDYNAGSDEEFFPGP